MKKLMKDNGVNDEHAVDKTADVENTGSAVGSSADEIFPYTDLSKIELDAQMDLESEITREMNQPPMVPDEPSEDTDSSTSEDVDTDPFCSL